VTVRFYSFVQLFNRGLVTRAVGDDEDVESRRNQKELDVETDRAAATATVEPEIQRGASLPGVMLLVFLYSVVTHLENLQKSGEFWKWCGNVMENMFLFVVLWSVSGRIYQ